jgi:hypothetical protein
VRYNVTFLENKVLEVNNGTGFIEGGVFGVGQPAPSRMEVGLLLVISMDIKRMVFSKIKLKCIHHK